MKKSILLLFVLLIGTTLSAQNINFSEKGISFQGIARDASGNAITNTSVNVVFTIGTWSEEKEIAVDNFGVFSHIVGSVENTTFQELDFSQYDYDFTVTVNTNEIYDGQLNSVPYAKAAGNGVPVGSIMPFAGGVSSGITFQEVVPGWIVCNGATIPGDDKYKKLKDVLGSAWGTEKVPDLRGTFLRGINNGRTDKFKDTDVTDREAVNGGNTGDAVGSFQGDTFKSHNHNKGNLSTASAGNHTHTMNFKGDESDENGDGGIMLDNWDGSNEDWNSNRTTSTDGAHTHTISGNTGDTGGAETRPVNAGVNFIIKY